MEQGVRQVAGPVEALASAPGGSDSNWIVVVGGDALGRKSRLGMLEHADSAAPQITMATNRFMVSVPMCCGSRSTAARA
jgi:hypothetical protein